MKKYSLLINCKRKRLNLLNQLEERLIGNDKAGLKIGNLGVSLTSIMFSELSNKNYFSKKGALILRNNISLLSDINYNSLMLSMEISETGWYIEFLKRYRLISIDEKILDHSYDSLIYYQLEKKLSSLNFDTCEGALAEGFYLISKQKINSTDLMWINNIVSYLISYYNNTNVVQHVGISHGICGILLFLNKCIERNIKNNVVPEAMIKIIKYISSTINLNNDKFFPTKINVGEGYVTNCWSFGDPGVLFTLVKCLNTLKVKQYDIEIKRLIMYLSKSLINNKHQIAELGVWYGASGILIYNSILFRKYKYDKLRFDNQYWFNYIEDKLRDDLYLELIDNLYSKKMFPTSLAHGLPGILLSLLVKSDYKKFYKYTELLYF
ncbi:lanthionine synthetase LanC family protein [Spirosoma lituiforme]